MKALSITLAFALTMMATVSQATLRVAPCGRIYTGTGTMLSNDKGVLNASNIGLTRTQNRNSQSGEVSSQN